MLYGTGFPIGFLHKHAIQVFKRGFVGPSGWYSVRVVRRLIQTLGEDAPQKFQACIPHYTMSDPCN